MAKSTWQSILKSQQQDLIERLRFSYDTRYLNDLLCFSTFTVIDEYCVPVAGLNSEIIELYLDDEHENKIDKFCCELVHKYQKNSSKICPYDSYINYKIGKLGEEAVKVYLDDLINEVNYELSEYGDGGIDFSLTRNPQIKIQVKTSCLNRISYYNIDKYKLTDDNIADILPRKWV